MSWPQDLVAATLCLTLSGAAPATAGDRPPAFIIQFQVLVLDPGVPFTFDAHRADHDNELAWAGAIDTIRVGDVTLDLDSDLMWNGQAAPPEGSGIELLTAPQVVVPEGTSAVLRSGSGVQYLERGDEGCYAVRTLPLDASPGVVLTVLPKAGPDEEDGTRSVALDFSVRIATMGDRQPVPGLDLDVGRPTIHEKEVTSRYTYPLGRWNLLTSHISRDGAEPEVLLVLLRARRPAAAQEKTLPIPELPVLYTARVVQSGSVLRFVSSLDLRLEVERISTREEVLGLARALAAKHDVYEALHPQPSAGWVAVGTEAREELRVVQWLPTEQGATLRAVTDRRLAALGVLNGPAKVDYPVSMVEIRFDPHGGITGADLFRAVAVGFKPDGTLETKSFDPQPLRLESVKRKALEGER